MKNFGSFSEFEEARNAELMRAYKVALSSHETTSMAQVFRAVVDMPTTRFWVSEERAAIVMSAMMKGAPVEDLVSLPTKQEMFSEIFRRVKAAKERHPGETIFNLTVDAVNSPAPKFYMTPGSAKVIINKIKKKWYEERKRKYRHLFM